LLQHGARSQRAKSDMSLASARTSSEKATAEKQNAIGR
jgi:hypothetical protein